MKNYFKEFETEEEEIIEDKELFYFFSKKGSTKKIEQILSEYGY